MSPLDSIRAFWAIPLPQEVKKALGALQMRLRSTLCSGSWPSQENLHLTLAFLGDLAPPEIPGMLQAIEAALAEIQPFELVTGMLGAFPQPRHAQVLWLSVREDPCLEAMASKLRLALKGQDISFDEKPFKPHLTLARFRNPLDVSACVELPEQSHFEVRRATLYRSHLTPEGARYEALGEVFLR